MGVKKKRDTAGPENINNKLRGKEEEFRLIFENARDSIFWVDFISGTITRCNRAAEILLKKDRNEIIGQNQIILYPPDKAEFYSTTFRKSIELPTDIHDEDEFEIITKSGKIVPVSVSTSLTQIRDMQIIQGIFRDITNKKESEKTLQKSKNKYKTLLENIPDKIFLRI